MNLGVLFFSKFCSKQYIDWKKYDDWPCHSYLFIELFQIEKSLADIDVDEFVCGGFSFSRYGILLYGPNGVFQVERVWPIWIWPNLSVANIYLVDKTCDRYGIDQF